MTTIPASRRITAASNSLADIMTAIHDDIVNNSPHHTVKNVENSGADSWTLNSAGNYDFNLQAFGGDIHVLHDQDEGITDSGGTTSGADDTAGAVVGTGNQASGLTTGLDMSAASPSGIIDVIDLPDYICWFFYHSSNSYHSWIMGTGFDPIPEITNRPDNVGRVIYAGEPRTSTTNSASFFLGGGSASRIQYKTGASISDGWASPRSLYSETAIPSSFVNGQPQIYGMTVIADNAGDDPGEDVPIGVSRYWKVYPVFAISKELRQSLTTDQGFVHMYDNGTTTTRLVHLWNKNNVPIP